VSVRRRLESLEERVMPRRHVPEAKLPRSEARRYMTEHLRLVARLRRGELGPEEAPELESLNAAIESRRTSIRGEG
jgi:hypothetical protein